MPEALFFEVLVPSDQSTSGLFKKFPDRENPVAIVGHVGTLMRHEIDSNEPSSPAERLSLQKRWEFNSKLRTGEFELTPQQRNGVAAWKEYEREAAESFLARYSCTHEWFPGTESYVPGRPDDVIRQAKKQVANDPSFVTSVYDRIRQDSYPTSNMIGPGWAIFRWLQVQLVYSLEYIRRHGPNRKDLVSKHVQNDVIDAQYATTALLANGLASDDRNLKSIYLLLNPCGELRTNT